MQKNNPGQQIIIVRRAKGHGHGHHGGSWKVALADFMTAMMAFFLLLWLLEAATPKELAAIAGYFQGSGTNQYLIGPGGADSSIIEMSSPKGSELKLEDGMPNPSNETGTLDETTAPADIKILEEQLQKIEQEQLEQLKEQLMDEINNVDSALNPLKEQIHMEMTEPGLSIQIVDKDRRPMFDGGSADMHHYAVDALAALAKVIDKVPNKISIVGHTDATPYSIDKGYSNWELSTDRANAARRMLLASDYTEGKIIAVQGMAEVAPFLPKFPTDPSNRRIAIIVLKKAYADAMLRVDGPASQNLLPEAGKQPVSDKKFGDWTPMNEADSIQF